MIGAGLSGCGASQYAERADKAAIESGRPIDAIQTLLLLQRREGRQKKKATPSKATTIEVAKYKEEVSCVHRHMVEKHTPSL